MIALIDWWVQYFDLGIEHGFLSTEAIYDGFLDGLQTVIMYHSSELWFAWGLGIMVAATLGAWILGRQ